MLSASFLSEYNKDNFEGPVYRDLAISEIYNLNI